MTTLSAEVFLKPRDLAEREGRLSESVQIDTAVQDTMASLQAGMEQLGSGKILAPNHRIVPTLSVHPRSIISIEDIDRSRMVQPLERPLTIGFVGDEQLELTRLMLLTQRYLQPYTETLQQYNRGFLTTKDLSPFTLETPKGPIEMMLVDQEDETCFDASILVSFDGVPLSSMRVKKFIKADDLPMVSDLRIRSSIDPEELGFLMNKTNIIEIGDWATRKDAKSALRKGMQRELGMLGIIRNGKAISEHLKRLHKGSLPQVVSLIAEITEEAYMTIDGYAEQDLAKSGILLKDLTRGGEWVKGWDGGDAKPKMVSLELLRSTMLSPYHWDYTQRSAEGYFAGEISQGKYRDGHFIPNVVRTAKELGKHVGNFIVISGGLKLGNSEEVEAMINDIFAGEQFIDFSDQVGEYIASTIDHLIRLYPESKCISELRQKREEVRPVLPNRLSKLKSSLIKLSQKYISLV